MWTKLSTVWFDILSWMTSVSSWIRSTLASPTLQINCYPSMALTKSSSSLPSLHMPQSPKPIFPHFVHNIYHLSTAMVIYAPTCDLRLGWRTGWEEKSSLKCHAQIDSSDLILLKMVIRVFPIPELNSRWKTINLSITLGQTFANSRYR